MRLLALLAMFLAAPARAAPPAEDVYAGGRWIAGDLHQHSAPADRDRDVTFTPHRIAGAAAAMKMEWVILTPHLRPSDWANRRPDDPAIITPAPPNLVTLSPCPVAAPSCMRRLVRIDYGIRGSDNGALRRPVRAFCRLSQRLARGQNSS